MPHLMKTMSYAIDDKWDILDFLLHTQNKFHNKIVNVIKPKPNPPGVFAERISHDSVKITYSSKRDLFYLAVGCVKGLSIHYAQKVEIEIKEDNTSMVVRIYSSYERLF